METSAVARKKLPSSRPRSATSCGSDVIMKPFRHFSHSLQCHENVESSQLSSILFGRYVIMYFLLCLFSKMLNVPSNLSLKKGIFKLKGKMEVIYLFMTFKLRSVQPAFLRNRSQECRPKFGTVRKLKPWIMATQTRRLLSNRRVGNRTRTREHKSRSELRSLESFSEIDG